MFTKPKTDQLSLDPDNDGLTTAQEYALGSDPYQFDTDGDGISDTMEVKHHTNPRIETEPITQPDAARQRYYHHACELLGWDKYSGLSWDTLYKDVGGQFETGWALDKGVYERAIAVGETPENAAYLLAQSPFLQYHKERGLVGVEQMVEYTQDVISSSEYSQQKFREKMSQQNEPELED